MYKSINGGIPVVVGPQIFSDAYLKHVKVYSTCHMHVVTLAQWFSIPVLKYHGSGHILLDCKCSAKWTSQDIPPSSSKEVYMFHSKGIKVCET